MDAYGEYVAIAILLLVIGGVVWRLPKIDLGHSDAFRKRRALNWLPLGLTYAFLYMARYNLKVSQHAFEEMPNPTGGSLMGNAEFAGIFGVGTVIYAVSFLLNGPLTDRYGGRLMILIGATGSAVMNGAMAFGAWSLLTAGPMHELLAEHFLLIYSVLYGVNMYFQSFGATAIVKVNAPWFHVRERGVFGAIFGILISLGIYFAFDLGYKILEAWGLTQLVLVPAVLLAGFVVICFFVVKNSPADAGLTDFDTADASSGDDGPQLGAIAVFKLMLTNPIILTIAGIEFCSGFLRQAIMQWFRTYAKHTDDVLGLEDSFVNQHWGLLLCVAGILGGTIAGIISDRVFNSRRGPVAALLYGTMAISAVVLVFTYQTPAVGWIVIFMTMAVIGVHGMLSGTASMDFGGKKNVGIAVGIIDGFFLPEEHLDQVTHEITGATTDPANWLPWPLAMIPMAIIGLILATRVWNAKPQPKTKPAVATKS
jgi:OPA family glycerol-3-phosphate transporter-like MFS transporter